MTAGIAVLIIFIHYVTLYQPTDDPFKATGETQRHFRPNPVDQMILSCLRRAAKRIKAYCPDQYIAARINRTFLEV